MVNYIYSMATAYLNLQKHLTNHHAATYDNAIVENCWNYPLSSDVKSGKSNTVEACKQQVSFIDYIICFVVADDQVSNTFSLTITTH